MPNTITVECLPHFKVLYDLPKDTHLIIMIGGRGSGKTYEASKWIAFQAAINKKRCVIFLDEKSLIRESILNEVLLRYDTANEFNVLDQYFQKMETGIRDRRTGEMIVFTKGFRASNTDKRANLKSISNIDYAIIEEAEDIRDETIFTTFQDGIRNEGSITVLILNTPDIQHFVIRRYFNLEQVEDGFYKLIPKKIPGFICIQTSFTDNPHLPVHIVNRYNSYGDSQSHMYNPHYYKTAILGWASSGRKGQVHKKVKAITLEEYMKLPFKEYYGQDFGTASPAGLVGVKCHNDNSWCRQLNYLPMNTLDIAKTYHQLNFLAQDKIIADSADKQAIEKLQKGYSEKELSPEDYNAYPRLGKGFYITGAVKGKDSLQFGISLMDSLNLYAVEESTDLWDEIHNRVYAKDKNENYTNEPEPGFDHLIDPWMYVCVDVYGKIRQSTKQTWRGGMP